MGKKRGNGTSGGGLKARRKHWEDTAAKTGGYLPNGNGVSNMRHHRPGSQNPRKGGIGRDA